MKMQLSCLETIIGLQLKVSIIEEISKNVVPSIRGVKNANSFLVVIYSISYLVVVVVYSVQPLK